MPEEPFPSVAFLGFAERAALVRDGETDSVKWNVLGLKNVLLTNFFPLMLSGWNLAVAIRLSVPFSSLRIKFKSDSGEEIGLVDITLVANPPTMPLTRSDLVLVREFPEAWAVIFYPIPAAPHPMNVKNPGRYRAVIESGGKEECIGEFYCVLVEPAPLTPERIAAIKSNPNLAQGVRIEFGCQVCPTKLKVYAALERLPESKTDGAIWYADIPDRFTCECGITNFDLSTVKRNLFAVIGQPLSSSGQMMIIVPVYEKSAVDSLRVEFINLLNTDPREESIQQFIERNPILLHQFPSEKLFSKPSILTRFKADFALVTPQKELVLIEIERASTRLLRSDGGQHADLTHAIDQIRTWLHELSEHRLAVLDSLGIDRDKVSKVRGIVIAGRDAGNDASHLRRLKGSDHGQVTVLTYDDIAAGLAALAHSMGVF